MPLVKLGRPKLAQAFRLALAAWVAFAVATAFGIEHAFWASMPIWVVAQPWRGVVFERAVWRFAGTVGGGAAGLLLLQYSPSPWFTALVLAILVAAGVGLTHLWHGVKSYLPLMAGITAAVVVIPSLLDSADGIRLALDRLACTIIGVISVTAIVGLFTPRANRNAFRDEVLRFADDVGAAALDMVEGRDVPSGLLLHRAADLESRARLIAAGSTQAYRSLRATDAVLGAGIACLEAASAVQSRLKPRSEDDATEENAHDILKGHEAGRGVRGPLARLEEASAQLAKARASAESGQGPDSSAVAETDLTLFTRRDHQRAGVVALLAFAASLAGSATIILTGSFSAELTSFSVTIFAMVLGSLPAPHLLARKVAVGVLAGVFAGALYRLSVQPWAGSWLALVLTIAPFMIVGALARVHPRTAVYALDANMCFMLASQAGAAAVSPRAIAVDSTAMALGTMLIVLCYLALPRPGLHLIDAFVQRLRRDIDLLAQRAPARNDRWGNIASRRILNLAIELDKAGEVIPGSILALSSLGHAIADLRKTAAEMGKSAWATDLLRDAMNAEGRQRIRQAAGRCDDLRLKEALIDTAIALDLVVDGFASSRPRS